MCLLGTDDHCWLSEVEKTNWLQIINSVLQGANKVAKLLSTGTSVVTHCSDGWDRTPQITSLVQFILDPYYRTFKGFQVLIEKEWVSFGHNFCDRVGHTRPKDPSHVSPIFLIFLDCIFQIMDQFPCSVEFNEQLLFFIMENVYACRFGNFLFNSEKQAKEYRKLQRTVSIWDCVNDESKKYKNLLYKENKYPLYPVCTLKRLKLWSFYTRYMPSFSKKESPDPVIWLALRNYRRSNASSSKIV